MSDWKATREAFGELRCVRVYRTNKKADGLVVMCHGFGAPGDDLVGLVDYWIAPLEAADIAPMIFFPEGIIDLAEEGMPGGRAWWRINMAQLMQMAMAGSFDDIRDQVPPEIDQARSAIEQLVDGARNRFGLSGVPLIVGGFSQGAMLAVEYATMSEQSPPQGIIVLSGALICESRWRQRGNRLHGTRVFQSHGRSDDILPIEAGQALGQLLQEFCKTYEWLEAPGPHYVPLEANKPICDLIRDLTRKTSATSAP